MSSYKLNDAIESWIDSLPDVEQQLINAKRRAKLLEEGPGGIMEMKQTIANKEAEIERLQLYKGFVIMIANEPLELSYEKIENQRNWWKKQAGKLLDKLERDPGFTSEELNHRLNEDF
jgi:hypothetical protein